MIGWNEPADPDKDMPRCQRCGHVKREHSYNGACYGLCGEFIAEPADMKDTLERNQYPDNSEVAHRLGIPLDLVELCDRLDRFAIGGLCAGTFEAAREFFKDIRRELDTKGLGNKDIPYR